MGLVESRPAMPHYFKLNSVCKTLASTAMSGYVECVFNLFRTAGATEHLMYKTPLLVLKLVPVKVVVPGKLPR